MDYANLPERLQAVITERIIDGTYTPGERLVELQLAKEFGVSQAPVREALRTLAAMRLVEIRPRRGTFVRAASHDDLAEVYLVRGALERTAGMAAYADLHRDPSALEAALTDMRAGADAGDTTRVVEASTQFHRAIVLASHNSILIAIWDNLAIGVRTLATVRRTGLDLHQAAEAHVPILEAFRSGTPESVGRLLEEHQQHYLRLPHD